MKPNRLIKLVLCILLAALPMAESLAAAGKFNFVIGDVRVVGAAGERKVERGSEVEASETIVSGKDGIAQLRMSDGAFIAVRPDTELRIDQHQYNGKPDESSSTVLSLVKGTFRAFTGAIARFNKDKFKMKTPGATIGIRGSGNVLNFSPNSNVTFNYTIEGSHTITAMDPSGVMRTLITMPGQTVQVNPNGVMKFVPAPAFILNAATIAPDTESKQQKKEESQSPDSDKQGSDKQDSDKQGSDKQGSDKQGSDKQGSDKQGSENGAQAEVQSGESKPSQENKQQTQDKPAGAQPDQQQGKSAKKQDATHPAVPDEAAPVVASTDVSSTTPPGKEAGIGGQAAPGIT